jgi:hypothetical protein
VGRVTGGTAVLPPGAGRGGSIAILAHYEGRAIAAGAVANRSAAAIGLSNVFSADGDLESAYVGAASAAQARWGSLPVVGYEFGDSLDAARRAGFSTVGGLAVWATAKSATGSACEPLHRRWLSRRRLSSGRSSRCAWWS